MVEDPFAGRHEITAEEWIAVVGSNEDASPAPQMPQDERTGTETRAKALLAEYLEHGGFGRVYREALVWPQRRFRADFFLPDQEPPVVIEYDGLMRGDASHASVANILRDAEKGNLAQAAGMRFYRLNAKTIHSAEAFAFLDSVLRRLD